MTEHATDTVNGSSTARPIETLLSLDHEVADGSSTIIERRSMNHASDNQTTAARILRHWLLAIFLFGLMGTAIELLLLGHTEDVWQWIPLALIGVALLTLGGMAAFRTRTTVRVFQITMALFLVGGLQGLFLHYRGNAEFELEMYPSLGGLHLVWESLRGATPTLAPGTMILLGLLGLVYSYCIVVVGTLDHRQDTAG